MGREHQRRGSRSCNEAVGNGNRREEKDGTVGEEKCHTERRGGPRRARGAGAGPGHALVYRDTDPRGRRRRSVNVGSHSEETMIGE